MNFHPERDVRSRRKEGRCHMILSLDVSRVFQVALDSLSIPSFYRMEQRGRRGGGVGSSGEGK